MLGTAGRFEEQQVGDERFNLFTKCPNAKTATIVLRGGSEQFIEESHRSIHDALCIVKRGLMSRQVVAGGGAIEMAVAQSLKKYARTITGKQQHIVAAFAKALEVVPRQLCENAGFDPTNVLQQLRQKHALEDLSGKWFGVDLDTEGSTDTMVANVWEPAINKINSYTAATEAALMLARASGVADAEACLRWLSLFQTCAAHARWRAEWAAACEPTERTARTSLRALVAARGVGVWQVLLIIVTLG